MKRQLKALVDKEFDLVVVGGGIFGICTAWDAVQRGLRVALVEQGDFAHATSSNCFKMVHGGIRYIQHADWYRVRESNQERNILLRTAPHLVRPLPIVVPTYGYGRQGRPVLQAALLAYDLLTLDRNKGITDPKKRIPPSRTINAKECLSLFPNLPREGLTGAAVFYDGQMYSPARLALAYLESAVTVGLVAANYVEVKSFISKRDRVCGINALDKLTGNNLEIRGRVVVNAAGPWADHLLKRQMGLKLNPQLTFSRDVFLIVRRQLARDHALALQATTSDPDAVLSRGRRHLFVVPWHGQTLVGVWHTVHQGEPNETVVTQEDLLGFLDEINEVHPQLQLTANDVSMWNAGLTLFGDNEAEAKDLSYGKRSRLIDHANSHGIEGLVTLIGVRYTTSRSAGKKAVDLVLRKLDRKGAGYVAPMPLRGADGIEVFDDYVQQAVLEHSSTLSPAVVTSLVHNHGSAYKEILKYMEADSASAATLSDTTVIKAEVVHAVHKEMAQRLGDVVFRRTDLGTGGHPGNRALEECAGLMAQELGWNGPRIQNELAEVRTSYPCLSPEAR